MIKVYSLAQGYHEIYDMLITMLLNYFARTRYVNQNYTQHKCNDNHPRNLSIYDITNKDDFPVNAKLKLRQSNYLDACS